MSTRLLLDEMFQPRIAVELTARGHDCVAIASDPDLRVNSDAELVMHGVAEARTLVTNNVVDFERLRRHRIESGEAVPRWIYTSDTAFPRDRRFVGVLIDALEQVCDSEAAMAAGGVLWLQPAHP